MVRCPKCGRDNALGRVFCTSCGSRLDVGQIAPETIARAARPSWFQRYRVEIIGLPVVVGLLAIAAALWPQTAPLGALGTPVGGRRAQDVLQAFRDLRPGQTLGTTPTLREAEINGYFAYGIRDRMRGAQISVAITPERIRVRRVGPLFDITVQGVRIAPRWSVEWHCVPEDGRLKVISGKIGHLPLPGPGKTLLRRSLLRSYASQPEWKALSAVREIRLGEGTISLVASR